MRLRIIGDRARFDADIQAELVTAERQTAANTKLNLVIALSYGGRAEIVAAARAAAEAARAGTLDPASLDEDRFASGASTAGIPDPDLIVRTSGEQRACRISCWAVGLCRTRVPRRVRLISAWRISPRPWPNSTAGSDVLGARPG